MYQTWLNIKNPGCLIGILIMAHYNPHIFGVVQSTIYQLGEIRHFA